VEPAAPLFNFEIESSNEELEQKLVELSVPLPANSAKIVTKHQLLTPALAEYLLSKVGMNRKIRRWHLYSLERKIRNGEFVHSPHGIVIDINGKLCDGQHRCHAVKNTGISIPVVISYGWDPEVLFIIDRNASRSHNDIFRIKGEEQCTSKTALIKLIWNYARKPQGGWVSALTPTDGELEEILHEFRPFIEKSINLKERCSKNGGALGVNREGALCFFLFCLADQNMAEAFVDKLITGANLAQDNPILALRTYLLRNPGSRSIDGIRRIYALIKTWNCLCTGGSMKLLRFPNVLSFPTIEGLDMSKIASVLDDEEDSAMVSDPVVSPDVVDGSTVEIVE